MEKRLIIFYRYPHICLPGLCTNLLLKWIILFLLSTESNFLLSTESKVLKICAQRTSEQFQVLTYKEFRGCRSISLWHYGLKLTVSKFSNFPLLNPSQIAPKFYSLVELCRAKNSTWVEADSIQDEPYAKICLSKCEQIELIGLN